MELFNQDSCSSSNKRKQPLNTIKNVTNEEKKEPGLMKAQSAKLHVDDDNNDRIYFV